MTRIATRVLGVSPEQFKNELRGRSLAEVAQGHGVSPTVLADAIRAELQTQAQDMPPAKLDTVVSKLMAQTNAVENH